MSVTLEVIREQFQLCRVRRETERAAFLSTIIGAIESKAVMVEGVKTVSEETVIAVLKSFEKSNAELLSLVPDNEAALREKDIILSFLPVQLSEDEIRAILVGTGITELPRMMAYLKENFAGSYDGKTASKIAKELSK